MQFVTQTGLHWPPSAGQRGLVALRIMSVVAFALLALSVVWGLEPATYNDSPTYLWLDFSGRGLRLWTVPAVYGLFGSHEIRVVAQTLIAVGCWTGAAASLSVLARTPVVQSVIFVVILALGLAPEVSVFHLAILSESLAMSLSVALVAAAVAFARAPSRFRMVLLALTTLLWVFTRHVHVLTSFVILTWVLVAAIRADGRLRRLFLGYAGAIAVMMVWAGGAFFTTNQITAYNSTGLLFDRVLPSQEGRTFVAERGLRVDPKLLMFAGHYESNATTVLNGVDVEVADWLQSDWERAYPIWLIRNPGDTLLTPLKVAPRLLAVEVPYAHARRVLPEPVRQAVYSTSPTRFVLILATTTVAVMTALPALIRQRPRGALVIAAAALCTMSTYYAVWWLSTTDLGRLMVPVGMMARLLVVVIAACSVEAAIDEWRLRRRTAQGDREAPAVP